MESPVHIDVSTLDHAHRQAMEDVLGRPLGSNDQLTIQISKTTQPVQLKSPSEIMDIVKHFYDGLTDEEIEEIDAAIKVRANLSRQFP